MHKRIRLNGGHAEINIGGFKYLADETGAFELPEEYTDDLLRIHGGEYDPGVEQLEDRIKEAEARVSNTKLLLEMHIAEVKTSRDNLEKYKKSYAERTQAAAAAVVTAKPTLSQPQSSNRR